MFRVMDWDTGKVFGNFATRRDAQAYVTEWNTKGRLGLLIIGEDD